LTYQLRRFFRDKENLLKVPEKTQFGDQFSISKKSKKTLFSIDLWLYAAKLLYISTWDYSEKDVQGL